MTLFLFFYLASFVVLLYTGFKTEFGGWDNDED